MARPRTLEPRRRILKPALRERRQESASARPTIWVLSGPNLDRLGRREPEIYGSTTLAEIHAELESLAAEHAATVVCRQSNHEGVLVDWIGEAADGVGHGILINPGALTHYSYALYDALKGSGLPVVEVHLSNPEAREPFRRQNVVAPACIGRVSGFGAKSYFAAFRALIGHLSKA